MNLRLPLLMKSPGWNLVICLISIHQRLNFCIGY
ncbi:hypothetical protein ERHA54_30900 [Erwinia rhapontici]|nr:hypothetical protein ERHA54_30900 [Erwinia rhapontici]